MRTNRIKVFQLRARRHALALMLCPAAIASYLVVSGFAEDEKKPEKPSVEVGQNAALRTVGIRLINSSGSAANDLAQALPSSPSSLSMSLPPPSVGNLLPAPRVSMNRSTLRHPRA
jgi:hypothetical protein